MSLALLNSCYYLRLSREFEELALNAADPPLAVHTPTRLHLASPAPHGDQPRWESHSSLVVACACLLRVSQSIFSCLSDWFVCKAEGAVGSEYTQTMRNSSDVKQGCSNSLQLDTMVRKELACGKVTSKENMFRVVLT